MDDFFEIDEPRADAVSDRVYNGGDADPCRQSVEF